MAVRRDDQVSINRRVAVFLASVLDIAFALHCTWHPGEKRLLDHHSRLKGKTTSALVPVIHNLLLGPPGEVVAIVNHV